MAGGSAAIPRGIRAPYNAKLAPRPSAALPCGDGATAGRRAAKLSAPRKRGGVFEPGRDLAIGVKAWRFQAWHFSLVIDQAERKRGGAMFKRVKRGHLLGAHGSALEDQRLARVRAELAVVGGGDGAQIALGGDVQAHPVRNLCAGQLL